MNNIYKNLLINNKNLFLNNINEEKIEDIENLTTLFLDIPNKNNPIPTILQIERILKKNNFPIDEILESTEIIPKLLIFLKSSSTNICLSTLHLLITLINLSKYPLKFLISDLHSLVRIIRGPNLMPFVCYILINLIEFSPKISNTLIINEKIIPIIMNLITNQVSNKMSGYLIYLLSKILKNAKKSMFYLKNLENKETILRNLILFSHHFIDYSDTIENWVLNSILSIFILTINYWNEDFLFILPDSIIINLLNLTKNNLNNLIYLHLIEVWNKIFIKFPNLFLKNNYFEILINYLFEKFNSRVFFLLSNFASNINFSYKLIESNLLINLLNEIDNFNLYEKENIYFIFLNLILIEKNLLNFIDLIELLFNQIFDFIISSISPLFKLNFLNCLNKLIELNYLEKISIDKNILLNLLQNFIEEFENLEISIKSQEIFNLILF